PCVVFNRTYDELDAAILPLEGKHDPTDFNAAMALALDTQTEHLGIFYQQERPTLEDRIGGIVAQNYTNGTDNGPKDKLKGLLAKYR
ncbi:MAG: hypothetical protein ABI210_12935, partial [Abditibacteriaceae bacterium]